MCTERTKVSRKYYKLYYYSYLTREISVVIYGEFMEVFYCDAQRKQTVIKEI